MSEPLLRMACSSFSVMASAIWGFWSFRRMALAGFSGSFSAGVSFCSFTVPAFSAGTGASSGVSASGSAIRSTQLPLTEMLPWVTTPGGDWIRFRMASPVVVLPAPVSPTSPRVSPFRIFRSRPLTA